VRIDTETHFFNPTYASYLRERSDPPRAEVLESGIRTWDEPSLPDFDHVRGLRLEDALCDLDNGRVSAMDEAGIDVQILSLSTPGCEQFEPMIAGSAAAESNDELASAVARNPTRFVGLAALGPDPSRPEQAAEELERAVTELRFRGLKINSHIRDTFLDDPAYRPILAKAEELRVPIYLHPMMPHRSMALPYMGFGFALLGPSLGFGAETALQAVRLIFSGVFDEHPDLQVVLGHLGEGLPFWLYRLDFVVTKPWVDLDRKRALARRPSEYLAENFYYTTSGNFRAAPFDIVYTEFGPDRMMFASDYPYESMADASSFFDGLDIPAMARAQIEDGTAAELFGIQPEGL
jgi:predicted TIM-barrel fold metal-dependent hydrolase